MPRPCPVVPHVGSYANRSRPPLDATGLPRGPSRWQLRQPLSSAVGCHGLAPWSLTLAATPTALVCRWMPRACPVVPHVGSYANRSRPLLMPRACPVVPHVDPCKIQTETGGGLRNVKHHGASPWHEGRKGAD